MCWVCNRLDRLVEKWSNEHKFYLQTRSKFFEGRRSATYHLMGDLKETAASLKLEGLCTCFDDQAKQGDKE